MAQRKRTNTKKASTKKRTAKRSTKKRTVKKTVTRKRMTMKKKTVKKGVARKAASKRKPAKHSSRVGANHVKAISNEIKRLTSLFVRQGEDAVEDEVDILEDKIKKLVREGKISEEKAIILNDELDKLDD